MGSRSRRKLSVLTGWASLSAIVTMIAVGHAAAAPSEPVDSPEYQELAAFVATITCPDLGNETLVLVERPFVPVAQIVDGVREPTTYTNSFACEYESGVVTPTDGSRLLVSINVTFATGSIPAECSAEPREITDDPTRLLFDLGRVVDETAVSLTYTLSQPLLDAHPEVPSQIAERFVGVAAQFAPRATVCQHEPPPVTCPSVDGFVEQGVEEPSLDHLMRARCQYEATDAEDASLLELTVFWATDRSDVDAQRRACEEFGDMPRPRLGVISGAGSSAEVQWRFGGAVESPLLDPAVFDAAAIEFRDVMAEHTVVCDPAWMTSPWTPLPPYLQEVYAPERIDAPPMEGAQAAGFFSSGADLRQSVTPPAPTPTSGPPADPATASPGPPATGGTSPGTPASDQVAVPPPSDVAGSSSGTSIWLRILTVVGLVVSLLALALAFVMIRKASRVRSRLDIARVVIVLVVAGVMMVVFSKGAPWWAVVAAIAVGAVLGWFQGTNLDVRLVDGKVMATRGATAVAVFAVGLVLTQIAGLANRTGVIALGIALSFLSAASTAGLVAGRRPKLLAARQAAAGVALLVVTGILAAGLAGGRTARAQSDDETSPPPAEEIPCRGLASVRPGERCPAHEYLIDLVDWGSIELGGGLLWDRNKPLIELMVPRGLDGVPEPVSRDVEWSHSFNEDGSNATTYTATETFSFDVSEEGLCCAVFYDGTAIEIAANGTQTDWALRGRLDDIEPIGSGVENSVSSQVASNVPFDEAGRFGWEPDDACHRTVGGTVANASRGQADLEVYSRNGEAQPPDNAPTLTALLTVCDIEGFTADAALTRAPDLAPRADRGSPCPAAMELYPALATDGYELKSVKMVGQLFTAPFEAVCSAGGLFAPLTFGDPRPGMTRSEFAFEYGSIEQQTVWGDDSAVTDLIRPADIDEDDRCETDETGRAAPIAEDERCQMVTMHQLDDQGSWIWVFTDDQRADGPNVTIRASLPWGSYWYNCHHCEVDSPEVQRFLGQFHDVSVDWIDTMPTPGDADTVIDETGTVGAPTSVPALADDGDPVTDDTELSTAAESTPTESTSSSDDAAAAAAVALIGLIGSGGILGTAIAESGRTPTEILDALRRDGLSGLDDLLDGEPGDLGEEVRVFDPDTGIATWMSQSDADDFYDRVRQERIDEVVAEQWSDQAAAERFGDMLERTIAENDALMEEIRDGWDDVDRLDTALARRDAVLAGLEAAEAEQALAEARTSWDQVTLDAIEGMERDVTGLPGEIVDATRVVVTEAADPENWRIATETAAETIYDALGIAAGNSFGDGAESIGNAVRFGGDLGAALAEALARDPVGTIAALTPINDFANAMDADRTLGERLGNLGIGLADIAATLAGAGFAGAADDLLDAARVADAAQDAIDTGRDVARAAERALTPEMLRTRAGIEDAMQAARAEAAARGVPVEQVLADMPDVRTLFQGSGMQGMGALEAAGGVSEEMAAAVVRMHDEITGQAIELGTRNAIDEMAELTGIRPREVLIGNSGSVGTARSVLTDADRTVVIVFSDDQLDAWRATQGGSRADAQQALQDQFRDLQRRHAELALNDPSDPAVALARQEGTSLDEAVARLQAAGTDDPAAAAVRLTGGQMDMQTYSGFGSLDGADDLYPAGFTQSRQSVQGSAQVYRIDPETGAITSYETSAQAIIDQHELNRLQATGSLTASETELGIAFSDPTRIPDSELPQLFNQQVQAIDHYEDVKSIAKAIDRMEYVASRTGTTMADRTLVDAAVAIRADPRATADILAGLGMTEQQFVEASQTMVRNFDPGFRS